MESSSFKSWGGGGVWIIKLSMRVNTYFRDVVSMKLFVGEEI